MTIIDFPSSPGKSDLDKAQELVDEAWQAKSVKTRITLAKKALEISPHCTNAYLVLGIHSKSQNKALEYFQKAVEAGKMVIGDEFEKLKGHFWGFHETRPYMRARAELARALWQLDKKEESIQHYKEMLELNPGDNQGMRWILAPRLLATQRYRELRELLESYEGDFEATWPYTKVLLEFIENGKTDRLSQCFKEAIENNKHVPKYLINPKLIPDRDPDTFTMGGKNQAIIYAKENIKIWHETKGAIDWLKAEVSAPVVHINTSSNKVSRNDTCPCGSGKKYKRCCLNAENENQHESQAQSAAKEIQEIVEINNIQNIDEINEVASLVSFKRNHTPKDDFLGLSPADMQDILYRTFESDSIFFTFPEKIGSPFLFLYQMLVSLMPEKGIKATVKGNLSLKVCKEIYSQYENPFWYFTRPIRTETDFIELHVVRLVAEMAGLIKKQKGLFTITRKAQILQSEDRVGELFHLLVKTYVEKFNWGYWDGYPDFKIIQLSALFMLYALQVEGTDWEDKEYYEELFLRTFPNVLDETEENSYTTPKEQACSAINLRSLQRFCYLFGFIEIEMKEPNPKRLYTRPYKIRRTPLLMEYISFNKDPD